MEIFHCDGVNCQCHDQLIEKYYCDIVNCLKSAERSSVPLIKVGVQKHWWSPELDDMKIFYVLFVLCVCVFLLCCFSFLNEFFIAALFE